MNERFEQRRFPGSNWAPGWFLLFAGLCLVGTPPKVYAQNPILNGVSCNDVDANGIQACKPSARGQFFFNPITQTPADQPCDAIINPTGPLPDRYGFDYLTGAALLRHEGAGCDKLLNAAYFCVHTAGHIGDANGDGSFEGGTSGGCNTNPGVVDGDAFHHVVSVQETYVLEIDRDCDGAADLRFQVTRDTMTVLSDDFTGHTGEFVGGRGAVWEGDPISNVQFVPPCPATADGAIMFRVPNWESYFSAALVQAPFIFKWRFGGGHNFDPFPEDAVSGVVDLAAPSIDITKTPDLALCPNATGDWTITVTNTGNTPVTGIVVTDQLPTGGSFEQVVRG